MSIIEWFSDVLNGNTDDAEKTVAAVTSMSTTTTTTTTTTTDTATVNESGKIIKEAVETKLALWYIEYQMYGSWPCTGYW